MLRGDFYPKSKMFCEPFMTKKNLYPVFGTSERKINLIKYMNLISYADGNTPLTRIAKINKMSFKECLKIFRYLEKKLLISFY